MARNYLTPEGYQRLKDEFQTLLKFERPKTVQAVSEAAAMGDRSENAEYIYGKRRLREIDRRLRFLSKRLEDVEIVDPTQVNTDKVSFGLWVVVEDEEGEQSVYQIVGEDEIDPEKGRITFSSPLGKALLGKKLGDIVTVKRPKGDLELEIVEIRAKPP
jgi:transcription elongation factor GreB